jgi:hypothetical protein
LEEKTPDLEAKYEVLRENARSSFGNGTRDKICVDGEELIKTRICELNHDTYNTAKGRQ